MSVYAGKYLHIDLSEHSWREVAISETEVKSWLLGSGLAARLFYDELDPDLDLMLPIYYDLRGWDEDGAPNARGEIPRPYRKKHPRLSLRGPWPKAIPDLQSWGLLRQKSDRNDT